MEHSGGYDFHDDDCRCVEGDMYCNRNGHCWSCCGACKRDSDCSAPRVHPTATSHPRFYDTFAGHGSDGRPHYRSNEEIRALVPESFAHLA